MGKRGWNPVDERQTDEGEFLKCTVRRAEFARWTEVVVVAYDTFSNDKLSYHSGLSVALTVWGTFLDHSIQAALPFREAAANLFYPLMALVAL